MRLIGQEVDALAEHQLNEFAGERLLTGLSLKCRSRPEAAVRLPFIECLLIDIGTQWEACVRLRPDAGALGHPPSNQACRKRRDGI